MTRKTTATQRFKLMTCRVCGNEMQVGANQRRAPRCVECGVKAMADNVRAMQDKSSPEYARWRKETIAKLERGY